MSIPFSPAGRQHELCEAARALVAIDEAGALEGLRDELAATRREWRREREAQPVGTGPWASLLAGDLAGMTGLPCAECERAMRDAIAPDWSATACAEIVGYAERLRRQCAESERPTIALPQRRRRAV